MKLLRVLFEVMAFAKNHPDEIQEFVQAFELVKTAVGEIKAAKAQAAQ